METDVQNINNKGELPAATGSRGRRRTTVGIKDVAARAGVSVASVSNALNRPEIVSDELARRVSAAIKELGFVPSATARSLRTGRVESIGGLFFDLANPFYASVARHMSSTAADRGYAVTASSSDQDVFREEMSLDFLYGRGIRGIAVSTARRDVGPLLRLQDRGMSLVLVAQGSPHPDLGWIGVDDRRAMSELTEHVIATGRRRIGVINGPGRAIQHENRMRGVRDAVRRAGLSDLAQPIEIMASAPDMAGGRAAARTLVERFPDLDAIMCINDYTATGALAAMQEAGRRVPEDVALTGFDDVDVARVLAVPLTTVRQPVEMIGRRAAELLIDAVESGTHILPPTPLDHVVVVRGSTTGTTHNLQTPEGRELS